MVLEVVSKNCMQLYSFSHSNCLKIPAYILHRDISDCNLGNYFLMAELNCKLIVYILHSTMYFTYILHIGHVWKLYVFTISFSLSELTYLV